MKQGLASKMNMSPVRMVSTTSALGNYTQMTEQLEACKLYVLPCFIKPGN